MQSSYRVQTRSCRLHLPSARRSCFLSRHATLGRSPLRPVAAASDAASSADAYPSLSKRIVTFIQNQYLPLALCTGLLIGYNFPQTGLKAANMHMHNYTTLGIFILSGLSLRRGEAMAAFKSTGAFLFGVLSILVITPFAALLAAALPLQPPELGMGLAVFCCMPTTLSSGVSMTQAVGGNTAMALLLTVVTNFAAVFTMPFSVTHILGSTTAAAPMSPWPLLEQLTKSILLPTVVGACARGFIPGVAAAVDANRKLLGYASSSLLALVPWMQISKAASQQLSVSPLQLLLVAAGGLAIHMVFLAFNTAMVSILQLGASENRREQTNLQRAVVLVASQKTLPVAVAVLTKVAAGSGFAAGLAVISCVLAHLGQILIDSVLVSRWQQDDRLAAA